LTARISGCAIEVPRIPGPGPLEVIYEEALCREFRLRGIAYERQKDINVMFKDAVIKGQRLDLVVEDRVMVEVKAVKALNDVFTAQTLS